MRGRDDHLMRIRIVIEGKDGGGAWGQNRTRLKKEGLRGSLRLGRRRGGGSAEWGDLLKSVRWKWDATCGRGFTSYMGGCKTGALRSGGDANLTGMSRRRCS